jgi:uncharacterized HhH-GPD family protein
VPGTLYITGDAAADELLNTDGTALLIGMLLDQQVPMEVAFNGPAKIRDRIGRFDAATIAATELDEFVAVCCRPPAIHRFGGVMAKRVHAVCQILVDDYDGHAENLWAGVKSADELYTRLRALPGFGDEKARIFIALLGKRMGIRPRGWKTVAGKFGETTPRSVADSSSPAALAKVREWKRAQKAARLDKQDRPLAGR